MTKMKKLLDVLSNPDARIPLGTLLKCEAALVAQLGSFKEQSANVSFQKLQKFVDLTMDSI